MGGTVARADDDWWVAVKTSDNHVVAKYERTRDCIREVVKCGLEGKVIYMQVKDARKKGVKGL
jgi:hypothetical protein